jgi:hypothetical protein
MIEAGSESTRLKSPPSPFFRFYVSSPIEIDENQ